MNEKAGLAASQDYGKDEDAATKYLKTHAVSWQLEQEAANLGLVDNYFRHELS